MVAELSPGGPETRNKLGRRDDDDLSKSAMNVWQEILSELKTEINPQTYQTWLRPTRFSHVAGTTLFVRVPNREFQDWM